VIYRGGRSMGALITMPSEIRLRLPEDLDSRSAGLQSRSAGPQRT